jgi:hypothetical protein
MRHSGVCEGCWIIKRSRLALGARGAGTHASPSKTFTTHVTVMTRYRVRILYQPPSHYSPRTPVTATDPVISVPRSCGAGCTPVRLPPFACLGLAHVLRAEPQISLRRTGRCPAWDRVDRGGDVACSPARPRSDDNVQSLRSWLYFRDFTTRHWGSHGHYQIKYVRYRSKSAHPSRTVERIPQTKNDARSTAARGPRHPIISVHYCKCFKIKCRSSTLTSGH